MVWTNPLDISYLFVNVFAGSMLLAIILLGLIMLILAARFKMPSVILASMFIIFATFVYIVAPWVLFLAIIIGGIVIYSAIGKFFQ
jgi:hypothetical protein